MKLCKFIETAEINELHEAITEIEKEVKRRQCVYNRRMNCRNFVTAFIALKINDNTIVTALTPSFSTAEVKAMIETVKNN